MKTQTQTRVQNIIDLQQALNPRLEEIAKELLVYSTSHHTALFEIPIEYIQITDNLCSFRAEGGMYGDRDDSFEVTLDYFDDPVLYIKNEKLERERQKEEDKITIAKRKEAAELAMLETLKKKYEYL